MAAPDSPMDDSGLYPDYEEDSPGQDYEAGWQLARRAIQMALNNRVDEAQRLLRSNLVGCPEEDGLQAQAGLSFLTFMVSFYDIESRLTTAYKYCTIIERL